MNIVIDSGSTKASWGFIRRNQKVTVLELSGFNPSWQTVFDLNTETKVIHELHGVSVENIYYYGAGVSLSNKEKVKKALSFIEGNPNIIVESDIMGAARALCSDKPGVIGILGTGSQTCFYNGLTVRVDIPSLGYILSDEGGGVHLGRELLKSYFYRQMPEQEKIIFDQKWTITREELIKYLYKLNAGSKFIAKFAEFLGEVNTDWTDKLISKVFDEFIQTRVLPYAESMDYAVHFVGSVALIHQKTLENCLSAHGLKIGKILQRPIESLIEFHKNQ